MHGRGHVRYANGEAYEVSTKRKKYFQVAQIFNFFALFACKLFIIYNLYQRPEHYKLG